MENILILLVSLLVGAALGLAYFGTLWLTVRRLPSTRHPFAMAMVSVWGRLAVLLVAFYYVVRGGHWQRLVACLIGFVIARIVLLKRLGPTGKDGTPTQKDAEP